MTEPVVVYEPPKVEVKFTEKQLARYHELGEREQSLPWEWGDQLVKDFPIAEEGVRNIGVTEHLRALAASPDVNTDSAATLEKRREVSGAWPSATRVADATWAAHRSLTASKYGTPKQRAEILKNLAAHSENGRVTERDVAGWRLRQASGVGVGKSTRPMNDAYLSAVDKQHKVAKHLLWTIKKFGDKPASDLLRSTLEERLPMFQACADVIEAVARGEELPTVEELEAKLDVQVW